jgi:hypothetical protein
MNHLEGEDCRGAATPGMQVVLPDGRIGTLAKWPRISNDRPVRVNLIEGGCHICRLDELRRVITAVPEAPQLIQPESLDRPA